MIPDFTSARVLVVGDLMLDRYWRGPTSRISPEAPVPVVQISDIEDRVGGAGNVALNCVALGAGASVLGIVGDDENAATLRSALDAAGVSAQLLSSASHPTITKLRILSQNQQLIRLDFEKPMDSVGDFDQQHFLREYQAALKEHDVVVLSDYGKGTLSGVQELIRLAREAGKPALVDPKGVDFSKYRGASVITPNQSEFEAVVGRATDEQDFTRRAESLLDELDLAALLVTRSEKGMSLFQAGSDVLTLPTEAREVFDVTGAGDTVIALLASALAAGQDYPHAAAMANLGAGVVVGKLGTATVTAAELNRAHRARHQDDSGVVDVAQLKDRIAEAHAHGETVVMTNGCFDLLHPGHVRYLKAARALGDCLVVAVNDDESVARLKGPERPVNPLDVRMEMLTALKAVDWVVPFSEDTPRDLICEVLPDLLVKGGDYKPEDIAGYDCVTGNGGDVVVLDFHQGYSTTSMIERLRQQD